MPAAYDAIADWYENEFLSDRSDDGLPNSDPIGVDGSLCEMLGQGLGLSLEIGCDTLALSEGYSQFSRELFVGALDDWGWFGNGEPPDWYRRDWD